MFFIKNTITENNITFFFSHAPQQAECSTEVRRQSCCLSEVLVPSSESNHADKHMLEQARVKKVVDITCSPAVT